MSKYSGIYINFSVFILKNKLSSKIIFSYLWGNFPLKINFLKSKSSIFFCIERVLTEWYFVNLKTDSRDLMCLIQGSRGVK